jgi:hypothetical protein
LGLAQTAWVLEVEHFGPFLVECDVQGRSLFGLANAEGHETFEKLYDGLPQPALKRLREVILPPEGILYPRSRQFAIGTRPLLAQHAQISGDLRPVMHLMLETCQDERQR